MSFRALPGFRDFYPEEMAVRRRIEEAWHAAAKSAGFEEIDGPPLESLDLLKAKSGDAIVDQIYAFTDKGGREVGLRPELTPTLARMVAKRAPALKKPVKWYSVPQLFRYERQQRGRLREHFQWNVDIVGAPEVAADAELVAVALDALQRLGLTDEDVYVRAFDRRVTEAKLAELGIEDTQAALTRIDRGQVEEGPLKAWLAEPYEPDGEFGEFLQACDEYGIGSFVVPDKEIVRGLAYYTGVVFEIFDKQRALRAVAGGGRYDNLVDRLGGPEIAATGFGMGDVVISELLKDRGLLPKKPPRIDTLVVPIGEQMLGPARRVVRFLRASGAAAEAPYASVRLTKAFKAALNLGVKRLVIVGPDEWAQGRVVSKDLASGEERVLEIE